MRNSSEAERQRKLTETARNTFRDTWILDGIENGGYENDRSDEKTRKENVEQQAEDAEREVVTVFKPGKVAVQGKRRRSSIQPFPRLDNMPEIRVVSATPTQSIFKGHQVGRAPLPTSFASGDPPPNEATQALHERIAHCCRLPGGDEDENNNHQTSSRQRGLKLAENALMAQPTARTAVEVEDEDEQGRAARSSFEAGSPSGFGLHDDAFAR